jgi:Ca-activated chloride channel family protein
MTTYTWTVTAPTAPGQYEFRFFANDTYTRLATSPPVTVTAPPPPPPGSTPELTVSATTVSPGGQVTVTLTNGPGGAKDWLALARVGAPDGGGQYVQWVYVGAGMTTYTWTVTAPSAPGQYEFRFFANDTYNRLATSPAVTVPEPALAVSATTAPPGGQITVTLTDSPGGSQDWLALAAVGAPATSYLQWVYVGPGVTTRPWTVSMPAASGEYEFRLFLNNGFTLAGTSPAVTVAP